MIKWVSGINNYRSHRLEMADGKYLFTTELHDVYTIPFNSMKDIMSYHVSSRQTKTVEVLYSGGMDSEFVLNLLMQANVPVRALTGRFLVHGYPINTHDLYYAEKFCRENQIEHRIVDINVDHFFENGDHIPYLEPLKITYAHVAIHLWLFEQCTGYPVLGGEYSWPWKNEPIISPHRLPFMCYDKFLHDRGIDGVGSMLGHSLESNIMLIENHLKIFRSMPDDHYRGEDDKITIFKKTLYELLGSKNVELRMKNYGWEMVPTDIFNIYQYVDELRDRWRIDERVDLVNTIKWNSKIASVLGGEPDSNTKH